ncbi:MAG TPA: DUF1450 domain-containing protein [Geobacteraceae bacterium]|nr:DUF1450 domain-containing protein [Geobacteraceae bacterium]
MKLKLCANNRLTIDAAKRVEREFPRLRVQIAACLRKCGPCREMLVAVLDGETVKASDVEDLLRQLRQTLAG